VSDSAVATSPGAAGETEAWRKLTSMALEALAKSPVEFSAAEGRVFSTHLRDSMAALDDQAETHRVLIAAGSLAQAIEQYNGQTQRHFDGLVNQLRELTGFLLERAAGLPSEFKQSLESALALQELTALQHQLGLGLETARTLPDPPAPGEVFVPPSGSRDAAAIAGADSCTGLLTQSDAEAVIRRVISSGAQAYVAAFYAHRMQLINARFGDGIGNQVILFCSQHIATNLSTSDTLFRWRGPGFVAVIERNESPLAIASEVQRFTSMPLSRFFETPSRTVYLPIKLTAEVFPTTGKSAEEVIEQVQKSMNIHSTAD
jgi:GGDEF domain-containing protein